MPKATINEIKAWLTPSLLIILGYLITSKIETLERKVDLINGIQTAVEVSAANLENLKGRVTIIETWKESQYAKHEDEITLGNVRK